MGYRAHQVYESGHGSASGFGARRKGSFEDDGPLRLRVEAFRSKDISRVGGRVSGDL